MSGYLEKWRPSLRMVLLSVSLVVLLLPLGGLHFLKIYESALIRQTESELISQAAFIAAAYKAEISGMLQARGMDVSAYGIPLPDWEKDADYYRPIPEMLDLAKDPILPVRPNGLRPDRLAAPLSMDAGAQVLPVLKEAQRMTLSGMKVLDYQGIQVAGQQETGQSFAHLTEVQSALKGVPLSVLRERGFRAPQPPLASISRGAKINVYVAAPIVLNNRLVGVALLNRTPTDIGKTLYGKRGAILTAAIFVLLATLGITWLTAYAITGPINRLIGQSRLIAAGDQSGMRPIVHPTTREIAILSENLATMARTIEHRSAYIRQFAMHVSHEFKTPLTSIQGSIELLQEHLDTMDAAQRNRFLDNIAQDTDRLSRLVSRLLELARADVSVPTDEAMDLLPLLAATAARYRDRCLDVAVEHPAGLETLPVAITREAMETVLANLLDNSLQHGATECRVHIVLESDHCLLRVADNGRGISPANRERLFTPFFTTHRDQGGTGLGLSIVQSLLQACRGSIQLAEPETPGAVFLITLPMTR